VFARAGSATMKNTPIERASFFIPSTPTCLGLAE
jgi:hypothetical protein